ncbi:hypothetical protein BS78_03G054400 [Paspalum vaginatum]|nr:hypothetical protein BS78_03G054400 [Paspalum vaginatum]
MNILESPLMGEFIGYLKSNWSGSSRVDQRRRRLRQLVAMVRAVADAAEARAGAAVRDGSLAAWLHVLRAEALRGQEVLDAAGCDAAAVAGSARRFLAGLKTLFVFSAEVDRLTEAVEELERLAGPGGDLDMFVKVLRLEDARATAAMDVDAGLWREASCGAESVVAGAKRKRACSSVSTLHDDPVPRQKRLVLAWMRPPRWLPPGLGKRLSAPPPPESRSHRARKVALAMERARRRIGKPTRRQRERNLGQHFSRISL